MSEPNHVLGRNSSILNENPPCLLDLDGDMDKPGSASALSKRNSDQLGRVELLFNFIDRLIVDTANYPPILTGFPGDTVANYPACSRW